MYIKKKFPFKGMISWTRKDIYKFLIISTIPVVLFAVFGFTFLQLPWLPIALVGTAVAFISGFKNNASYDRLWEARKIWGGIVNTSRSWGIMTRDFISNQHAHNKVPEEELKKEKLKIINRHIAWMAAHRYALRAKKPWEGFESQDTNEEYKDRFIVIHEKLEKQEDVLARYLDEEELTYVMSKSNKATTLISLQSQHIKELKNKGLIWEFSYLEMENLLVEMYTLQGKNERIKNFPYPRQFATLNYTFVMIFILLLPFGIMGAFDEMGQELSLKTSQLNDCAFKTVTSFITKHFVWLTIPFCTIISWVFNTIEKIGEVSENPFEGTPNDIPITSMSRGIEIDLLEMFDQENIPENIPIVNDIQM